MLVKEKRKTLVSLPPLSNQERELYKEAGLSAGSSCLPAIVEREKMTTSNAAGEGFYNQTHQAKKNTWRKEKGEESCLERKRKERRRANVVT